MSETVSSWSSKMLTAVKSNTFLHMFLVIALLISGLIVNGIQCILFYTLRPLNMRLYQHINYYLIYSLHTMMLFLPEWWSNSDFRVYTDAETMEKLGKEDILLIGNHTYDIDWMLGWLLGERVGILGGQKCIVKRGIASVPTFGWAWGFSDFIFLDRNWEKDKSIISSQCVTLQDYATRNWLTIFPEGTRFTEEKHKASMEFARKQGIPLLKRLLIPRTKGFVHLVQSLKGHYPAIYDMTVSYNLSESASPQLANLFNGKRVVADCYLRRYDLTDLPDDDEGISEWLHECFREKDALLDSYMTCGSFTDSSGFSVLPMQHTPRRFVSLIPCLFWFVITAYIMYRAAFVIMAQGLLGVLLAGGTIAGAYIGLQKLINITRTDKGSSYGSRNNKKE